MRAGRLESCRRPRGLTVGRETVGSQCWEIWPEQHSGSLGSQDVGKLRNARAVLEPSPPPMEITGPCLHGEEAPVPSSVPDKWWRLNQCVWVNEKKEKERERKFLLGSQESICRRSCGVSGVASRAQGHVVVAAAGAVGSQGAQETRGWQARRFPGSLRATSSCPLSLACSAWWTGRGEPKVLQQPFVCCQAPSPEPSWQGSHLTSLSGAWGRRAPRAPSEWWKIGLALGSLNALPTSPA